MKTLQILILLIALTFTSFLAAETITSPVTLDDGTVIPAGAVVSFSEDGTVQYTDEKNVILAQITSTMLPNGGREIVIIKLIPSGIYVRVRIVKNPDGTVYTISQPDEVPDPAPIIPVTPTDDTVGGDSDTQGPTGDPIPNNPVNVI